ncbi:hypothetical protein BO86DRAFT_398506 [Aspergillus japonicus CBS 114.51]|uniref:Uncharacterized protein n=1 Tax=Aspergillus japonicus CBS 114.51 TaxID=1448312 RepID=A0A8T8X4E9_ASPJA|nr:hypothetical protein BO86DRAFT_398506 [Aspergillus japonicus CBS 114.51]RAH82810.1 hypothetical protein BO86DRAFT_398506 [Aspergillus japonicus CBS 114.51]
MPANDVPHLDKESSIESTESYHHSSTSRINGAPLSQFQSLHICFVAGKRVFLRGCVAGTSTAPIEIHNKPTKNEESRSTNLLLSSYLILRSSYIHTSVTTSDRSPPSQILSLTHSRSSQDMGKTPNMEDFDEALPGGNKTDWARLKDLLLLVLKRSGLFQLAMKTPGLRQQLREELVARIHAMPRFVRRGYRDDVEHCLDYLMRYPYRVRTAYTRGILRAKRRKALRGLDSETETADSSDSESSTARRRRRRRNRHQRGERGRRRAGSVSSSSESASDADPSDFDTPIARHRGLQKRSKRRRREESTTRRAVPVAYSSDAGIDAINTTDSDTSTTRRTGQQNKRWGRQQTPRRAGTVSCSVDSEGDAIASIQEVATTRPQTRSQKKKQQQEEEREQQQHEKQPLNNLHARIRTSDAGGELKFVVWDFNSLSHSKLIEYLREHEGYDQGSDGIQWTDPAGTKSVRVSNERSWKMARSKMGRFSGPSWLRIIRNPHVDMRFHSI